MGPFLRKADTRLDKKQAAPLLRSSTEPKSNDCPACKLEHFAHNEAMAAIESPIPSGLIACDASSYTRTVSNVSSGTCAISRCWFVHQHCFPMSVRAPALFHYAGLCTNAFSRHWIVHQCHLIRLALSSKKFVKTS